METLKKYGKWIAILIIFLVIAASSVVGYNKYFPKGIIAGLVQDQVAAIEEQYQQDLAEKDREISMAKSKLKKSEDQVATLNKKMKDLEGQIINVQKPVTSQETKDRLRALGYTPIR